MVRRTRNRVGALITDADEWLFEPKALANQVQQFYVNLFSKDDQCDLSLALNGMFSAFNVSDFDSIHAPITLD